MATVKLVLDKRVIDKEGKHHLAVLVNYGKNKCFLNIAKMTEVEYDKIFIKKNQHQSYIDFRKQCQERVTRAEEIVNQMTVFDRNLLRKRFLSNDNVSTSNDEISLKISDLFRKYIEQKDLALRTKKDMETSVNIFTENNDELTVLDITEEYLRNFQKRLLDDDRKTNYVSKLLRYVRSVLNYFSKKPNKIIPDWYENPFNDGGFKIPVSFVKKEVLHETEIRKFVDNTDFKTPQEEYARDMWYLTYLCNGVNFADLLQLRWDQKKGNHFMFFRKKTKNTTKIHKKELVITVNSKVEVLLEKWGNKESKFVLGKLRDNYTEQYFENKLHKYRVKINKSLRDISERLELSIPMKLATARDCYAPH